MYDDVLSMAWVFLELIVKSMALEQSRTYCEALPPGKSPSCKIVKSSLKILTLLDMLYSIFLHFVLV